MQLFADIEEKWRNEVGQNVNRGGSKANKGARELKRLQCSINYEGRKKSGEKVREGEEGINLIIFNEDQNS